MQKAGWEAASVLAFAYIYSMEASCQPSGTILDPDFCPAILKADSSLPWKGAVRFRSLDSGVPQSTAHSPTAWGTLNLPL